MRRKSEIISGKINADGTINSGERFTIQRTGVGQYIITFEQGFRLMVCVPSGQQTSIIAYTSSQTERGINVTTAALTTGTVTDALWAFIATGFQQ